MTAVQFSKTSPAPIVFDKASGRCVGWGCFSKKGGVEYDDLHGDHIPDDEVFKAVGGLMKREFSAREINVEHIGAAQGSIVTAWAMTERVAKSLGIDTGGNYGALLDFEPGPELLAKIEAGEAQCLSMEGVSHNVQVVKAAGGAVATTKRKRVLRGVDLTKWAVCTAGAHEGAEIADIIKAAGLSTETLAKLRATAIVKRCPGMTTEAQGHSHVIYDCDEPEGRTSWEELSLGVGGHSHPFIHGPDGALLIGTQGGHTHELLVCAEPMEMPMPTPDPATASDLAKARSLLSVAVGLSPEQAAFAKTLPADKLEGFLAKSEAERATSAAPIFKAADGAAFYAGQEQAAALAKRLDEQGVELAKAREAAETAELAKTAADVMKNLPGTIDTHVAVLKAIRGIAGAVELLKGANAAMAKTFTAPGFGGGNGPGSAEDEFNKGLAAFAKAAGKRDSLVADEFLATPEGARLYAAYDAETAARRRSAS